MPIDKLSNYTGTEGFDQQNTEEKQQKYLRDVDYDLKRLFAYVNALPTGSNIPKELFWKLVGTSVVLVDSDNNVGIGSDTATQKLDVDGNIVIPADRIIYLDGTAGGTYIKFNSTTRYLELYVDGSKRAEF